MSAARHTSGNSRSISNRTAEDSRWRLPDVSVPFWLCCVVLISSLLLGGSTRSGFLGDVIVQLLAVPIVLAGVFGILAAHRAADAQDRGLSGPMIGWWLCLLSLPLIQLIPLPPPLWTILPGHQDAMRALALISADVPWMPLSLAPQATLFGFLSLLPPFAVFVTAIRLSHEERRAIVAVVVVFAVASALLGMLQVAQGPHSPLRPFSLTNDTEAVGLFANRNHFAIFICVSLLLLGNWLIRGISALPGVMSGRGSNGADMTSTMILGGSFLAAVVLIAAEAVARSRAGLGLTMLALLFIVAVAYRDHRHVLRLSPGILIAGVVVLTLLLSTQFTLFRILDRFDVDPLSDARLLFAERAWNAILNALPFGTGIGSFPHIYATIEQPSDVLIDTFANRAHNDYLEFVLETGVAGFLLICALLAWLAKHTFASFSHTHERGPEADTLMKQLVCGAMVLVCLHSIVDYPLRTGAMVAVVALLGALLVEPVFPQLAPRRHDTKPTRKSRRRQRMPIDGPVATGGGHAIPSWPARAIEDAERMMSADQARHGEMRAADGVDLREQWPTEHNGSGKAKPRPD